jgi:hypothetical protein
LADGRTSFRVGDGHGTPLATDGERTMKRLAVVPCSGVRISRAAGVAGTGR